MQSHEGIITSPGPSTAISPNKGGVCSDAKKCNYDDVTLLVWNKISWESLKP